MSARADALARLQHADVRLAASHGPLRSLAPERALAHGLEAIGATLFDDAAPAELVTTFAELAIAWRDAIASAFPDNLLWDCDLPLACWWRHARGAAAPVATARALLQAATALQRQFSRGGALGFRYAHDFLYGFDWAKWVARAPEQRAPGRPGGAGPFDPGFLAALRQRGEELCALVARGDDAQYPPLGGAARNPFPFSREPDEELALHRALAAAGEVPVIAWSCDGEAQWSRPFAALRRERAARMGLSREQAASAADGEAST
ncbi:MAG: ferrochelatase [Nannocystaceae bacterium]|nr:ferrochelatase [Nannocystaceae bacterium]